MIYKFYKILTFLTYPVIKLWIFYRLWIGKEEKKRILERSGISKVPRPKGKIFWFHGASIGEAASFLPVLRYFQKKYPRIHFLVTTGTKAAAKVISEKLPPRCVHQYVPLDHPLFVKRFLTHWNPTVGFWTESDLWPNLIFMSSPHTKLFFLNGRLSKNSFEKWKFIRTFFRNMLNCFIIIFPQTPLDLKRFSYFKVKNLKFLGNLKYAGAKLDFSRSELKILQEKIYPRPLWIASNTHAGEEEIIITAHKQLKKKFKDLLLILIPRHPERVPSILKEIEKQDLNYTLRSQHSLKKDTDIYIVDTLGEVGLFYNISDIVFMGGSLRPKIGGHNILEAVHFGNAVLMGPYMENNQEIANLFLKNKAVLQVSNTSNLAKAVEKLLTNFPFKENLSLKAQNILKKIDILTPLLQEIEEKLTLEG